MSARRFRGAWGGQAGPGGLGVADRIYARKGGGLVVNGSYGLAEVASP